MKKFTSLLAICLIFGSVAFAQDVLLVGWTFPTNSYTADTGLNLLLDNEITTMGGTSALELKNGFSTNAPQATGWNLGMETKAWLIKAKTTGYHNLTISSRQQSGGNEPGPKYYKIQFSINNGASWSEVIGGEVEVENDWETSYVSHLSLPAACNDCDELWIRWVMALNTASGNGGAVTEEGKSKIDDIFLHGDKINGVEDHMKASFTLFPNPSTNYVEIKASNIMTNIQILDISGKIIHSQPLNSQNERVDVSSFSKGYYFISIQNKENQQTISQKLLIH